MATECAFFADVANAEHEVNQVVDRKDPVVQRRVLAVDGFDEAPVLVDYLHIVGVDPEVGCVHQVDEKHLVEYLAVA